MIIRSQNVQQNSYPCTIHTQYDHPSKRIVQWSTVQCKCKNGFAHGVFELQKKQTDVGWNHTLHYHYGEYDVGILIEHIQVWMDGWTDGC